MKILLYLVMLFILYSCSSDKVLIKNNKEKKENKIINSYLEDMAMICNQRKVFVCNNLSKELEKIIVKNKLENYLKSDIKNINNSEKLWEIGFLLKYRKISEANSYYFFKKSCDLNNIKSCRELGIMYLSSYGYLTNISDRDKFFNSCKGDYRDCSTDIAKFYLSKACDENDAISCIYLGYISKLRYNNLEETKSYFKKSCDLNNSLGCLLHSSTFYPSIKNKIIKTLEKSCFLGEAHSCYNIIEMTNKKIIEYNSKKIDNAIEIIIKSCDMGDEQSCSKLGNLYISFPHTVSRNLEKAKSYFKRACNMNSFEACSSLSYFIYEKLDKNYKMAELNYYKSCIMNFAPACMNLGFLYYNDIFDVDEDIAYRYHRKACLLDYKLCNSLAYYQMMKNKENLALNLYSSACNMGDGSSCLIVAEIYKKNNKNYQYTLDKAVNLLSYSCKNLNVKSCLLLAKEYNNGKILKKSESKSKYYYMEACKQGNLNSCKIINSY